MSKKQYVAQLHALDRVMYLLEERSFQRLEMDDSSFAEFIESLYQQVERQAEALSKSTRHTA